MFSSARLHDQEVQLSHLVFNMSAKLRNISIHHFVGFAGSNDDIIAAGKIDRGEKKGKERQTCKKTMK